MNWKNLSYTKKGTIVGFILLLGFVLFVAYQSAHNQLDSKNIIYSETVEFCGSTPSDNCLLKQCKEGIYNECNWLSEEINTDKNECIENRLQNFCKQDWPERLRAGSSLKWRWNSSELREPSYLRDVIFHPNIHAGLESILILRFLPLLLPIIGFIIGFILQRILKREIT